MAPSIAKMTIKMSAFTAVLLAMGATHLVADAATVDAGVMTTITVDAPLYDTRTSDEGGCDPAGCSGDLTRDDDLVTLESRWSCKPELGGAGSTCSITYNMTDPLYIQELNIAMYKGDERTRTIDIYVDGVFATSWTSSGTTLDFEAVALDVTGDSIELSGVLEDSEWLSIMEVEILVDETVTTSTPTSAAIVEAGTLGTVIVTAPLYDPNTAADNGCDPAGCIGNFTKDGDMADTSRWSCAPKLGGDCSITYDLRTVREMSELRLALYKGDERTRTMEVYVDGDLATTWTSSGTTDDFESIDISGMSGEVIEIKGVLEDSEWLSIIETEIMIVPDGSSPTPIPTPAPTGNLESVGLIPLASTDSTAWESLRYYAKDNDMSTSWTCDNSTNWDGECKLMFDLFWYRNIKQVKIALSNGDEAEIDIKIGTEWYDEDPYEMFVTSPGTTTDFVTYEFNVFTKYVVIGGYVTGDKYISISEVEFIEEVQAGEIPIMSFETPYDTGDGTIDTIMMDGFEWWSESDDALDEELVFMLSTWSTLTAVGFQFPTGDTYLFELHFYTEADGAEDPFTTITGIESEDTSEWQTFEVQLDVDQTVTEVHLVMKGTGSGASGFYLLDARFMGTSTDNPTDTFYVGSPRITEWDGPLYPDFVGDGRSDQEAIMGAICSVKKASFDGVDCVDEDAEANGTVTLSMGEYFVDGNIFIKSGVVLNGEDSIDDWPYNTVIFLDDDAAGNTDIDAIIVVDGVTDAVVDEISITGLYDPDSNSTTPAVAGLGSTAISITNSQNIMVNDAWIGNMDGDVVVVRDSQDVTIDAGEYDEEYWPYKIADSRGTGLLVDGSENVYIRRHAFFDNGEAGIHITGSTNFTFEATIGDENEEGEGYVGSVEGEQPIEVIVESSSLITFQDMSVRSANDPVMTVSVDSSDVYFNNCGFSEVEGGICAIQTEDPSVVTVVDDELELVGNCYVKV